MSVTGASESILVLSIIHYHPRRDEKVMNKYAELSSGRKYVVSTAMEEGSNVVLQKATPALQQLLDIANSLGFRFVMFSPAGAQMDHLFPAFTEEWDDIEQGPNEYEVIGDASFVADTPQVAAEEFVRMVSDGEIVVTVRNINTDAISDVHLKNTANTNGNADDS